jgi:hypothetical protein
MRSNVLLAIVVALFIAVAPAQDKKPGEDAGWSPLFTDDGEPKGFHVTAWDDVSKPPPKGAKWLVKDGVLHGSNPRGTWLVSDEQYGDFELRLEFKIAEGGNSGVGLRFPAKGDPAFDGLELQIMGATYRGNAKVPDNEKTGGIYQLFDPKDLTAFKPNDWNRYHLTLKGPKLTVKLNETLVQDVNLDEHKFTPQRGKPPAERPRKGHIGFQELSRGNTTVQIRSARLRVLE